MPPPANTSRAPRRDAARIGIVPATLALVAATSVLAGCGADTAPRRSPASTVGDGSVLVATLGDSILAGTPRWDPDPDTRAAIDDPDERHQWQYWAAREHPEVRFRNCGVNRERTDQIATRLASCARGADVLLIQGGINDLAQGRGIDETVQTLRRMVAEGRERGAQVLLADVLPWNAGYPDYAGRIRELNDAIHAMARRERVEVLPFHDTLEDPDAPGRMRGAWTIDGSHPSVEGHRRLGELAFTLPPGIAGDRVGGG